MVTQHTLIYHYEHAFHIKVTNLSEELLLYQITQDGREVN